MSLYVLGIPPNQYHELVAAWGGNPVVVLRERVEKLACDFPIRENYFAWQAFARGYDIENRKTLPTYLRPGVYQAIRTRTDRVKIHHASLTDFLRTQAQQFFSRYVLLDSQDWMTRAALRVVTRD